MRTKRRSGAVGTAAALVVVLASLTTIGVTATARSAGATTTTQQQAIVAAAASENGAAYCYGGGGIHGPSGETNNSTSLDCAPPKVGFDCMSLAQYAVYQGTGIAIPGDGTLPAHVGRFIPNQVT